MSLVLFNETTPANVVNTTFAKGSFSCQDFWIDIDTSALQLSTNNTSIQVDLDYKNGNGDIIYNVPMVMNEIVTSIPNPADPDNDSLITVLRCYVSLNDSDVCHIDIKIIYTVNVDPFPTTTYTCTLHATQQKPAVVSYSEDTNNVTITVTPSQNIQEVHFGIQYDCNADPNEPDYPQLWQNKNPFYENSSSFTEESMRAIPLHIVSGLDTSSVQSYSVDKNKFYALPLNLKTIVEAVEDISVDLDGQGSFRSDKFRSYKLYQFTGKVPLIDLTYGQTYNGTIDITTSPVDFNHGSNRCVLYKLPVDAFNYYNLIWSGPTGSKLMLLDKTLFKYGLDGGVYPSDTPGTYNNIGYFQNDRQRYIMISSPITGAYSLNLVGV